MQCVFVDRGSAEKRAQVVAQLQERARDPRFPPVAIYPEGERGAPAVVERVGHARGRARTPPPPPLTRTLAGSAPAGTTTGGHAVLRFQTGAFRAPLPIQPVAFHCPYARFNPAWAESHGGLHVLKALAQVYNSLTIAYLPVYSPNAVEAGSPRAFADGVQRALASELGVPALSKDLYDSPIVKLRRARRRPAVGASAEGKQGGGDGSVAPPLALAKGDGAAVEGAEGKDEEEGTGPGVAVPPAVETPGSVPALSADGSLSVRTPAVDGQ